jgi:hypothetical protein
MISIGKDIDRVWQLFVSPHTDLMLHIIDIAVEDF